jgi:hypothetical protein
LPEPSPGHDLAHVAGTSLLERRALRHEPEPPPRVEPVGRLTEQPDRAGGRFDRTEQDMQERRFAGPVRSDERDELSGPDLERDVLDHGSRP